MSAWLYLLQQTACAWSLLLSLGLFLGLRKPQLLRLTAAALACGATALFCAVVNSAGLCLGCLLFIALLAPLAAWPGIPPSRRWSLALCSLTLTLLMTGCGRLLHSLGVSQSPLILTQFALLPCLIHTISRTGRTACTTVKIVHAARHITLTALVDSGNLLRDPLTQLPVIVISRQAAVRLMDKPEFSPGMRLISVRTVAGSALMPIFRPQQIRLLLPGGWHDVRAVVGLSPEGYSGYQALVPASITSSLQGGISICP